MKKQLLLWLTVRSSYISELPHFQPIHAIDFKLLTLSCILVWLFPYLFLFLIYSCVFDWTFSLPIFMSCIILLFGLNFFHTFFCFLYFLGFRFQLFPYLFLLLVFLCLAQRLPTRCNLRLPHCYVAKFVSTQNSFHTYTYKSLEMQPNCHKLSGIIIECFRHDICRKDHKQCLCKLSALRQNFILWMCFWNSSFSFDIQSCEPFIKYKVSFQAFKILGLEILNSYIKGL